MDFYNGVTRIPIVFVNAYLIATPRGFALVDSGLAGIGRSMIQSAVETRFGAGARPDAIYLTHGHFDHAGSARALSELWDVPIFAHRLELPYLTGHSQYPPADPTVGGMLANLSRLFPSHAPDLSGRVRAIPNDGELPGLPEWRVIPTPGHTRGHVSFFRPSDGLLLAGDALATMDQESPAESIRQTRQLRWPPAPLTTDWRAAQRSLEHLATLRPSVIAAGHGVPIDGSETAERLSRFVERFRPPSHGRYVVEPAVADESGVVRVPPPVWDPVGLALRGGLVGAAIAAAWLASQRGPRRGYAREPA